MSSRGYKARSRPAWATQELISNHSCHTHSSHKHTKKETCKLKPNPAMTSGNCEQQTEKAIWKRSELLCRLRDKSSLSATCLSPLLWSAHWVLPNSKTINKTTIFLKVYFNCIHMYVYNYIYVHACVHPQRPEESIWYPRAGGSGNYEPPDFHRLWPL